MKVTEEQIIDALKASHGFQSQACKMLEEKHNITFSPSAMTQRINQSEKIRAALAEIRICDGDYVENKLWKLIKEDNATAIIFYLKTKCKERGYSERRELTGAEGRPIQITDPLAGLSKEELMQIAGLTPTRDTETGET